MQRGSARQAYLVSFERKRKHGDVKQSQKGLQTAEGGRLIPLGSKLSNILAKLLFFTRTSSSLYSLKCHEVSRVH